MKFIQISAAGDAYPSVFALSDDGKVYRWSEGFKGLDQRWHELREPTDEERARKRQTEQHIATVVSGATCCRCSHSQTSHKDGNGFCTHRSCACHEFRASTTPPSDRGAE